MWTGVSGGGGDHASAAYLDRVAGNKRLQNGKRHIDRLDSLGCCVGPLSVLVDDKLPVLCLQMSGNLSICSEYVISTTK
jgi:hypothetical protein